MMSTPSPARPGALNWALIVGLGVIWGGAFLSVRIALDGFTPLQVAAGRLLIGALALTGIASLLGQSPAVLPSRRAWVFAAVIGAGASALPITLLAFGQQYVPSAFAGVAMGAVPLLVLPLVWAFSPEEGIGPRRLIGMGMGFAGLLVLTGPGAFGAGEGSVLAGRVMCIGAALCYAAGSVATRRAPPMPPLAFASVTLLAAAAILVPVALVVDGVPRSFPAQPVQALIYAALLPTALAAAIRVRVITTAGSLFMSITSYMVPVWSVIFGLWLGAEELPPTLYSGLGLILAGILISQSRSLFGR